MNPLISICVPVYNVAPNIERCVRSLMEQTYENIEYVFVNDCSTDSSVEILQNSLAQYPDRLPHARIIHNDRNHGLAYTRRVSIEAAHGEYICCVDSDDFVETEMVERLHTLLVQKNADVISGGNYVNWRNKQWAEEPYPAYNDYDSISFNLRGAFCSLCGALYKRELFTPDIFSPEGMDYLEDRLCRLKIALTNAKIVYVNVLTYHYVIHDNSITATVSDKNMRCFVQFWQIADQLLAERGLTEKYRDLVAYAKVQNKTSLMLHCNSMQIRKQYAMLFHEEEKTVMHTFSRGFWMMSHLIHYKLWGLIRLYQCYINVRLFFKRRKT